MFHYTAPNIADNRISFILVQMKLLTRYLPLRFVVYLHDGSKNV